MPGLKIDKTERKMDERSAQAERQKRTLDNMKRIQREGYEILRETIDSEGLYSKLTIDTIRSLATLSEIINRFVSHMFLDDLPDTIELCPE